MNERERVLPLSTWLLLEEVPHSSDDQTQPCLAAEILRDYPSWWYGCRLHCWGPSSLLISQERVILCLLSGSLEHVSS